MEYADFVIDYGIKYVNQKMQTLQNQGLYIVFDQHFLPYDQKDSTEVFHRQANIFRLSPEEELTYFHLYSIIEILLNFQILLELPTRRHVGILFKEIVTVHHKAKQNPLYRAIFVWNKLPVNIRNIEPKELFKRLLVQRIQNPFRTFV